MGNTKLFTLYLLLAAIAMSLLYRNYMADKQKTTISAVKMQSFSVGTSHISPCTKVTITEKVSPTMTVSYDGCKEKFSKRIAK